MRKWKEATKKEAEYFASLEEETNMNYDSAFNEALENEQRDMGGETKYDFLRDIKNGVYKTGRA